jgi:hypothetical protein
VSAAAGGLVSAAAVGFVSATAETITVVCGLKVF